jgi:hypothetical protein
MPNFAHSPRRMAHWCLTAFNRFVPMQTVSSQLTLFFKMFLPIFWLTFWSSITLTVWFYDPASATSGAGMGLKMTATAILLLSVLLMWRYILPLKRVEMGVDFMHVTNYIKNFRYPLHNIDHIVVKDFGIVRVVHVTLKVAGNFGKRISFLASSRVFNKFLDENPQFSKLIIGTK